MTEMMFDVEQKSIAIVPCEMFIFNNELPRPTNKLNNGPDIEPANAISPYPLFTKLMLRTKSEMLLPYVNTVIPKKVSGIRNNRPIALSKSIKLFAMNHIHIKDIMKVNKDIHSGQEGIDFGEVV